MLDQIVKILNIKDKGIGIKIRFVMIPQVTTPLRIIFARTHQQFYTFNSGYTYIVWVLLTAIIIPIIYLLSEKAADVFQKNVMRCQTFYQIQLFHRGLDQYMIWSLQLQGHLNICFQYPVGRIGSDLTHHATHYHGSMRYSLLYTGNLIIN